MQPRTISGVASYSFVQQFCTPKNARFKMQPHNYAPSRRTPPPDGVSGRNAATPAAAPPRERSPPQPEFLIVGLFALRLAKCLIEGLDNYANRDADIAWLTNFLAPYPPEYGLAKTFGARKADYIATYQEIVSRMKKQPRYPMRFMQVNPNRSMQQRQQGRAGATREPEGRMTDRKSSGELEI
jgi:hypothetical protein